MSSGWKENNKSSSLEAKFVFENYEKLRDFLDKLAEKTEEEGIHPNISFGRDYASLIIYAQGDTLSEKERGLAGSISDIASSYS